MQLEGWVIPIVLFFLLFIIYSTPDMDAIMQVYSRERLLVLQVFGWMIDEDNLTKQESTGKTLE